MIITEMPQCRNFNCKYHSGGGVSCRLRSVCLDINGKCVYCEEKERKINLKYQINMDRKYIHEKIMPEIITGWLTKELKKMGVPIKGGS